MLEAFEVIKASDKKLVEDSQLAKDSLAVVLNFSERQKSRYKAQTQCGQDLAWYVERGTVLSDGDLLVCSDGQYVKVVAAQESVSNVYGDNVLHLTQAAYHLGNRHVPLQVSDGYLRYLHDHVLDKMVRGLGLTVESAKATFHPESGAYSHGSSHGHSHSHDHTH